MWHTHIIFHEQYSDATCVLGAGIKAGDGPGGGDYTLTQVERHLIIDENDIHIVYPPSTPCGPATTTKKAWINGCRSIV